MNQQVQFVYLDELRETANSSLSLGIVQLVVENEATAVDITNQLIQQAQQELEDEVSRRKVLELIETILVYKFTNLSRQELEAMFGLDELKQTRYFREVAEEAALKGRLEGELRGKLEGELEGELRGKLKSVPRLLQLGLTIEQIATALDLDVEVVTQAAQSSASDTQGENAEI